MKEKTQKTQTASAPKTRTSTQATTTGAIYNGETRRSRVQEKRQSFSDDDDDVSAGVFQRNDPKTVQDTEDTNRERPRDTNCDTSDNGSSQRSDTEKRQPFSDDDDNISARFFERNDKDRKE